MIRDARALRDAETLSTRHFDFRFDLEGDEIVVRIDPD
jgi:hypothetical protein